MTSYHLGGTDLTQLTEALADDDRFLVNNKSDTTTAPADADGSSQWIDAATAAKAFYRGALLVLPSASNVASTNATLVNNAISAAVTAGIGVVKCAPVAWNWAAGTVSHDGSGVKLDLEGCSITGSGSGDLIRMFDSSDFDTRTVHGGGVVGFPRFYGTSMTSNSCAVHIGDIPEADVEIMTYDFNSGSDSMGLHWDNCYGHSEGSHARVFTQNCMTGVVHDVNGGVTATGAHVSAKGSYMRCVLDYQCVQGDNPAYKLVEWRNGAFQVGGRNGVHGNVGGSASGLTQGAISITGSTPSGITEPSDSILLNVELNWDIERDGTDANSPMTVNFGGGVNAVVNCTGVVNFGAGAPMQSSNSGGQWVGFVGTVGGDANLPSSLPAATTNVADGNQAISATSATAITSLALPVAAFVAYKIDLYIPHVSASASGTYTIALGGPSINAAALDLTLWSGTTATPALRASPTTGALLTTRTSIATAQALHVKGTIVFSAAGTLTVTGLKSSGGANLTIDAGASLGLTPMSAP